MSDALSTIVREAAPWSPQGEAAEALTRLGLPTRRNEAWKYSDLRAALADGALLDGVALADGHVRALEPDAARFDDQRNIIGLLAVAMNANIEDTWAVGSATRGAGGTVSEVETRGKAVIIERLNAEGRVGAHMLKARVREGAELTRVVLQNGDGVALSAAEVAVEAGGVFRQFVVAEGAKLARIETHVIVEGERGEVTLNGAYLAGAGRHADITSTIEHKAPGGVTRQLTKGVARKGGRGVFQGKIVVERAAQKTDARQHHQGLLLEDGAEIFAKPELMIHADDVQCAHGNTAGGLDERALFYMRSRGIPEAEARALLIEAFLTETIPAELPEALREEVTGLIRSWLAGARS
ncbi:MAG: SufD family Fe-S cluster assembly protein [Hyphomonadaceae bacterium]